MLQPSEFRLEFPAYTEEFDIAPRRSEFGRGVKPKVWARSSKTD